MTKLLISALLMLTPLGAFAAETVVDEVCKPPYTREDFVVRSRTVIATWPVRKEECMYLRLFDPRLIGCSSNPEGYFEGPFFTKASDSFDLRVPEGTVSFRVSSVGYRILLKLDRPVSDDEARKAIFRTVFETVRLRLPLVDPVGQKVFEPDLRRATSYEVQCIGNPDTNGRSFVG